MKFSLNIHRNNSSDIALSVDIVCSIIHCKVVVLQFFFFLNVEVELVSSESECVPNHGEIRFVY